MACCSNLPQIISCYQYFPERSLSLVIYFGVLISAVHIILLFKKLLTSQWHPLLDSLSGQNPPFNDASLVSSSVCVSACPQWR